MLILRKKDFLVSLLLYFCYNFEGFFSFFLFVDFGNVRKVR